MPTTFVKGDFINEVPKSGAHAFACPVDASGMLDAGVAVAVAKRWPAFAEWWAERSKNAQLGDAIAWSGGDDVIYALVMHRRGAKAKVSWLERSVAAMVKDAGARELTSINAPRLWGGPSGLDGDRSKRILDEVTLTSPVALAVYEQFIRRPPAPEAAPEPVDDEPKPAKKKAPTRKAAAAPKKKAAAAPKKKPPTSKAAAAPKKKPPTSKAAAAPKKKSAAKKK